MQETAALYGQAREAFTAARNERAKELKRDDPELAAAVAGLPKPTVAAAALNELVREEPSEARALVQAGRRLREAQEQAVAGKGAGKGTPDLAEAIREHRAALDRVQRDLRRRKLSGATLEKAVQTLRVASVDPELQPLLERGTLAADLAGSGFGIDPALVPARPQSRRPKAKAAAQPKPDRRAEERRRREARQRLREAEATLKDAEQRARAAQRELERAAADVEKARRAAADAG